MKISGDNTISERTVKGMKNRNLRKLISFALAIVTAVSVIGGGWLTTEVAASTHTFTFNVGWALFGGDTKTDTVQIHLLAGDTVVVNISYSGQIGARLARHEDMHGTSPFAYVFCEGPNHEVSHGAAWNPTQHMPPRRDSLTTTFAPAFEHSIQHELTHNIGRAGHCNSSRCIMNSAVMNSSLNQWCDPCRNAIWNTKFSQI
jgi:hypothetical protein